MIHLFPEPIHEILKEKGFKFNLVSQIPREKFWTVTKWLVMHYPHVEWNHLSNTKATCLHYINDEYRLTPALIHLFKLIVERKNIDIGRDAGRPIWWNIIWETARKNRWALVRYLLEPNPLYRIPGKRKIELLVDFSIKDPSKRSLMMRDLIPKMMTIYSYVGREFEMINIVKTMKVVFEDKDIREWMNEHKNEQIAAMKMQILTVHRLHGSKL